MKTTRPRIAKKSNPRSTTALTKLLGRWETREQDSSAVIQIQLRAGRPVVIVHDDRDGEQFRVL